ncbi:MAG TPA: hypothetical protein PLD52_06200 [Bacteroidales bacterium]|nr:hypothetical protein [Bacteroidales bacterium]
MKERLSVDEIAGAFRQALSEGMIREKDTAVMFHDLDFLKQRIQRLISVFPGTTLHALAIKANPLRRIMEYTKNISPQTGVEAASIGEVYLALQAGYPPQRIVYDSPVKTRQDLAAALNAGVHINADSLAELDRIAGLVGGSPMKGAAGIRINPQSGSGTIAESSTAGEYSKFGVPIKTERAALLRAFREYPWLTGVHLHVGSQGCHPNLLAESVGVLVELVKEAESDTPGRITRFDIGGGFPISYGSSDTAYDIEDYAHTLRSRFPILFAGHRSLITEFGRWVFTNTGWTASRVEYIKHDNGINTAMIHTGADLFLRECFNPKAWHHEYSVVDRNGQLKTNLCQTPWNLAGPLCFSGDIMARNVLLPELEEGDYLIIHDTGGYTFSMWSRYNSRFTPRIMGYTEGKFQILKERESAGDLARFWE